MNHYPRHVGDITRDTFGLSLTEFGAYDRLLDAYYATERPIPHAERYRLTGAVSKADKAAVDYVIGRFFVQQDDGLHQKRADAEIAKYRERSAGASESAHARWSKRNANAMRTHSEGNANQEPVTSNHKPRETKPTRASALPEWLPPEVWQKWAKHRGNKLTPQAKALQIGKLEALRKIGHDPAMLVDLAIESGWATFYPPRGNSPQVTAKQDARAKVAAQIFGATTNERVDERVIDGEAQRVA